MKKLAVFVEGMTEQELVIALVTAVVGLKGLHIERAEQFRNSVSIRPIDPPPETSFFVLIVNCRGDEQVKTQIREQYSSLITAGYKSIIGLRDVYPLPITAASRLAKNLMVGIPTSPILPSVHLAVMEVEAWFIAEVSHFLQIHPQLTPENISAAGFDIIGTTPDAWHHPAAILDNIYKIAGIRYTNNSGEKRKNRVQRTIRALSFENIYEHTRTQVPAINEFINSIEAALF